MKILRRWTSVILLVLILGTGALPPKATAADLPIKFFLVHVDFIGDPKKPEGIKVSLAGQDVTKAPDGASLTTSGSGAFDPSRQQAEGSGKYILKDAGGAVKAQGAWQVTGLVAWQQLPGGFPPGFKVEAPPPPAGTVPSAGLLKVNVKLENQGDGVMEVHCKLPTTPNADKLIEGIVLTGGKFNFMTPVHTEGAPTDEGTIFFTPQAAAAPARAMPTTGGAFSPDYAWLIALGGLGVLGGLGLALRRRYSHDT